MARGTEVSGDGEIKLAASTAFLRSRIHMSLSYALHGKATEAETADARIAIRHEEGTS